MFVVEVSIFFGEVSVVEMSVGEKAAHAISHPQRSPPNRYIKKRMLPSIGRGGHHGAGGHGLGHSATPSSDLRPDRMLSSDARYTAARARVRKRLAQYQRDEPSAAAMTDRKSHKVQTDQWLEEIKDRQPEVDVGVQTEETGEILPGGMVHGGADPAATFAPESALPGNAAPGVDKATQIMCDDPDLFDFDSEVAIVLDAMVGKTVEQSLLEVIDEEETAALEGLRSLSVVGTDQAARLIKAA